MSRRLAREKTLQVLFAVDVGRMQPEAALAAILEPDGFEPEWVAFARRQVLGTLEYLPEIDPLLRRFSIKWSPERMGNVDRNILRLAIYELLHCPDIPPNVTINEAVELAKKFQDQQAAAFINGILDRVKDEFRPGEGA